MEEAGKANRNRLKWHCRRALLELDLVFQRFWNRIDNEGGDLDAQSELALQRLLAMEDHDLWALVSGKEATGDPELSGMIARLRAI